MEIIFHGKYESSDVAQSVVSVIEFLHKKYKIAEFKEMHLSLTMVDNAGFDVELIDSTTDEVYRKFDVYRQMHELKTTEGKPALRLVVDNK
jgi:hypothetical protein